MLAGPVIGAQRKQIVELAVKSRLPAIYPLPEFVEAGGLMSYGANFADLYRRAATYVDKILKGAKPADLPVEQPTKFELIINLKAAKQIGLTIPPNVLVRADKVIKMSNQKHKHDIQKTYEEDIFSFALCAMLFALCVIGRGAAAEESPSDRFSSWRLPFRFAARIEAFRQGLRELGYVEGKNIVIEWRYAEGKPDRLPALAAELVRLKVDVIVTGGPKATRAAKEATATIPIVMAQDRDPVGNGFVASLARPGGNITGLSNLAPELSGKRLELLKEIVPKLSRVAVLGTSTNRATHKS